MKSLGRIFELGSNGNKPFKNKYVIVYENKTYFECKEFGTDYPKIILDYLEVHNKAESPLSIDVTTALMTAVNCLLEKGGAEYKEKEESQ